MKSDINTKIVDRCTKSMPRIKVAILDTGYDRNAEFFNNASRKNRMRDWKDWVNGSSSPEDDDSHGTHVVSLIMKTAPAADIYVARVAKNAADLRNASKNVGEVMIPEPRRSGQQQLTIRKAIAWAANTCEADIISMSFGFPEEVLVGNQLVISNAILKAISDRNDAILFFAAAANSGANEKEMFPATHEFVISIRATNSNGSFEDFNPPADRDGPAVFGTLGKDVPSASLCSDGGEVCKSGTSVATPIAAGIAAMMLGYATIGLHDEKLRPETARKLRTRHGMKAMFREISTLIHGKYYYLCPGEFSRKQEPEQWAAMITAGAKIRR